MMFGSVISTSLGRWFDGVIRGGNKIKPLNPESVRYAIDVARAKLQLAIAHDDDLMIVYHDMQLKRLLEIQSKMARA
jgi:hypothetical protein